MQNPDGGSGPALGWGHVRRRGWELDDAATYIDVALRAVPPTGGIRSARPAPPATVTAPPPLLERDKELRLIEKALAEASAGAGRVLVVEGPAGIGKSRLLEAACAFAPSRGMVVHRGAGGELEQDLPWDVVRQLLAASLERAPVSERAALLAGPAAHAATVLGHDPAAPTVDAAMAFHALHWLLVALSARQPLLLAVDDAQWADAQSLSWLAYAARRLENLPVLLALAVRTGEPGREDEIHLIRERARGRVVRPGPLGLASTARLVNQAVGTEPSDAFVHACGDAAAGNPYLLRELLKLIAADRISPTAESADRLHGLSPAALSRAIFIRLARLPSGALEVARAIAILGPEAHLRHVAALTGLDEDAAARACDALAAADVIRIRTPLTFVHPIVRSAVHGEIPAAERGVVHRRAAALLAVEDVDPAHLASHLVAAPASGESWVVERLRDAARLALDRGAPDAAAAYLRRAASEPPEQSLRAAVLHELGAAELRASEPTALEHLESALHAAGDAVTRARIASDLGRLLFRSGPADEAMALLEREVAALPASERELELRLRADLASAAWVAAPPRADAAIAAVGVPEPLEGATPGERLVLAMRGFGEVHAGASAERAADLALRAVSRDALLQEEGPESPVVYVALSTLTTADRLGEADAFYAAALQAARNSGSPAAFAIASTWRCRNSYLRGELAAAEADGRAAIGAAGEFGWLALLPVINGFLVDVLLDRCGTAEAAAALEASGMPEELPDSLMFQPLLCARGRLRLAQGHLDEGAHDLLECGRRHQRWAFPSPGLVPWRASVVPALAALGRAREAQRIADEGVREARRFGAPRPLGVALRAAGMVAGDAQVDRLSEAANVLERSCARLEHARALLELGAALRRSGRRSKARDELRGALDAADRCGATPIAERARSELLAAGARPRRPRSSGRAALTPSELRVAELAGAGKSNQEIAQALFVTLRTVETHLTRTYRKLDIDSRAELPAALGQEPREELTPHRGRTT